MIMDASVELDGLTVNYRAPRPSGAPRGRRVLYVHGTGCNARVWDDHMAAIVAGHQPVAIDLPGHGRGAGASAAWPTAPTP